MVGPQSPKKQMQQKDLNEGPSERSMSRSAPAGDVPFR